MWRRWSCLRERGTSGLLAWLGWGLERSRMGSDSMGSELCRLFDCPEGIWDEAWPEEAVGGCDRGGSAGVGVAWLSSL